MYSVYYKNNLFNAKNLVNLQKHTVKILFTSNKNCTF